MKKLLLLLAVSLISCERVYYRFDKDFRDFRWEKESKKTFEFDIAQTGRYTLVLKLSHFYDYPYADLPLQLSFIDASGKTETFRALIPISDASGNRTGECALDICDLNFNIKNDVKLRPGNYKIVISNAFNGPYLPEIIGIGLEVRHFQ